MTVHVTVHVTPPHTLHDVVDALHVLSGELLRGDVLLVDGRHATPVVETRPPLTLAQANLLAAVRAAFARTGHAPSLRELCADLGYKSTNGVSEGLARLDRKGYLTYHPGIARGIVLPSREVVHRVVTHYSARIKAGLADDQLPNHPPEESPMNDLPHPWVIAATPPAYPVQRLYWYTARRTTGAQWSVPLLVELGRDDATGYKVMGDLVSGGYDRPRQGDLGVVDATPGLTAWAPCEVPPRYPASAP